MKEPDRKKRNDTRLAELYPTFRVRMRRVLATLESNGVRPRIQDAWRSPEDQRKAYESGHSRLLYGFHNVTGKSGTTESLAVDLLDDDSPLAAGRPYLLKLAATAEKAGLITGIRWGVPSHLVAGIDEAIAAKNWGADVKVGWGPTHVQPVGVTVSEARAGKRPA